MTTTMVDVLVGAYGGAGMLLFLSGGWLRLCAMPADEEQREEANEVMRMAPVWPFYVYKLLRGER